jgi:hypothetical protein
MLMKWMCRMGEFNLNNRLTPSTRSSPPEQPEIEQS